MKATLEEIKLFALKRKRFEFVKISETWRLIETDIFRFNTDLYWRPTGAWIDKNMILIDLYQCYQYS